MKLYLVHCGYYPSSAAGIFEAHQDVFVVAESFADARLKAKRLAIFKENRMHVDGMIEVDAVQGFKVVVTEEKSLEGKSVLTAEKHRDLAPPSTSSSVVVG